MCFVLHGHNSGGDLVWGGGPNTFAFHYYCTVDSDDPCLLRVGGVFHSTCLCLQKEQVQKNAFSVSLGSWLSSTFFASCLSVTMYVNFLLQVQYYGLIKQQTGEDWENAKISLSTAQPSIGGSAPSLPTRIVRFKRPVPVHYPGQPRARWQSVSHNVIRSTEGVAQKSTKLAP